MEEKTTDNPLEETIRLNKYLANAGICSRRKADELILAGNVEVNGEVIKELGHRVTRKDKVVYNGKRVRRKKFVYILLNKPKDFVTTTQADYKQKTVMNLVQNATKLRVYPVGKLDKYELGLLLFTNDGDLANLLANPESTVNQLYAVELDKPLAEEDLLQVRNGVDLGDFFAEVKSIEYVNNKPKYCIGIQIDSNKHNFIKRVFDKLNYRVRKIDRVRYAHLTKKDLQRGSWRMLSPEEVNILKHFTVKKAENKTEEE